MFLITDLRRALTSNLRTVSASTGERASLEAAGTHEPTIQNYFAWRRSTVAIVVLFSLLSAGLTIYRKLTENDDRPAVIDTISEKLIEQGKRALPAASKAESLLEQAKEALPASRKMDESDEEADEEAGDDETKLKDVRAKADAAGKKIMAGKEAKAAVAAGKEILAGEEVQAAVAAGKEALAGKNGAAATDENEEEDEEVDPSETSFGKFEAAVELMSDYALPIAALAVLFCWTRFKLTFQILMGGFVFSFLAPMLISFAPWSWWGVEEQVFTPGTRPTLAYYKDMAEGIREGAEYLFTLLPIVLSLVPGVQRACVRVKTLLPESMLPGWFLVAASPCYALFLLIIFVGINQAVGDTLFLAGMFLFIASPLVYVIRFKAFTNPLTSDADYKRIRRVQSIVGGITALAGGLLVVFLATREIFGIHLIGFDEKTSLLLPIDLLEFGVETIGRSMFLTVLVADLFMRMNLSVWRNDQAFIGTPEAANYDRVMGAMEQHCGMGILPMSSGDRQDACATTNANNPG